MLDNGLPSYYLAKIAQDAYTGRFAFDVGVLYSGGVDNTQFHVLDDGEHIICTFTGSNEVKDWMTHLLVRRRKNVHRGHMRDYEEIADTLRQVLDANPRRKLVCTSHSYGCSVQCIALRDIAPEGRYEHIQVASFGSPRVGNKQFCRELDALVPHHHRYVNRYDVVTKVPLGFGYRHCGTEVRFPRGRHSMADYLQNLTN